MAYQDTVKEWFRTGLKPTQAQFWAKFSFLRWKDETVPVEDIAGLTEILNGKAEEAVLTNHLTDEQAHADLFDSKVDKNGDKQLSDENYTAIDKVKLAYLDETKDIDKPVSTAQALADSSTLANAHSYADGLITQLKGGTPLDADTLKKINDKVIALQSIVGGTTPDGDTVVNTLTELMAVLTNYPEGTDLFTLVSGKVNKTDIYNALDCVVSGKVADARQLKVLNDALTALTATVNNKVDKVAGERLINAAEITKLSGLTNVTTTVKSILSTALASQDVAGFVTYLNALTPLLVVGANEIVEYKTTDTGRVFKLLLRGRSFGVGQAAIVAADVIESTEFLNKDIKLGNYPSTRNDGQLPTNKVLAPDVNGNIKLYTIATAPPPYMEVLIPDSTLPSTTTNFTIKGAFFTPTMTVSIVGQTINYITFVSDNLIKVNVTTGAAQGSFAVTLNNGISSTYSGALVIVLGTVYSPTDADWTLTEPVNTNNSEVQVQTYNSIGTAKWNKAIDISKNFRIYFTFIKSPLGPIPSAGDDTFFTLRNISNSAVKYQIDLRAQGSSGRYYFLSNTYYQFLQDADLLNKTFTVRLDYVSGIFYAYKNDVLVSTLSSVTFTENMNMSFSVKSCDVSNIKYVELA